VIRAVTCARQTPSTGELSRGSSRTFGEQKEQGVITLDLSGFASGLESLSKGNASIAHLPLPSIWFEGADINVKKAWAGLIGHLRICPSCLLVQPQFRRYNQTDPVSKNGRRGRKVRPAKR
jgi:hypothetical protein